MKGTMSRSFVGFAAVLLCLSPVKLNAQHVSSDAEVKAAIATLGDDTDKNGFAKFEILYKNPRRSSELLISC
jgi:hypothetical protein